MSLSLAPRTSRGKFRTATSVDAIVIVSLWALVAMLLTAIAIEPILTRTAS